MVTLLILLLFNAMQLVKPDCSFSSRDCYCRNIQQGDFLNAFFRNIPKKTDFYDYFSLTITDSNIPNIDYIPALIPFTYYIKTINIQSSSLERIGENAFDEYNYLTTLVLKDNNLRNMSFVKDLSTPLRTLDLSRNNFTFIEDVFQKFANLQLLDLSCNLISILDLNVVFKIREVNLYNNVVKEIIPAINRYSNSVNLSRNSITSYNETELNCNIYSLDISYNKLEVAELQGGKGSYFLSGNKLEILRNYNDERPNFYYLDISNQESDMDKKWNFQTKIGFSLANNKIPFLSNETFDIQSMITGYNQDNVKIDIKNCSIYDIAEYYFKYFRASKLDLSHNNISTIRSYVFNQCRISTINLSYSRIKLINSSAFANANIGILDLSHNELDSIENVLDGVEIEELDLSYNNIRILLRQNFAKISYLRRLRLANCRIEIIEPEAFTSSSLEFVDLSFNRLVNLETNTFSHSGIHSLNLDGNAISSVKSKAFNNLSYLIEINLFGKGIKSLEENAFFKLDKVNIVDLRNNNISIIPKNLFVQTPYLKNVLLTGNNIKSIHTISNRIKISNLSISLNGSWNPGTFSNINLESLLIKDSEILYLQPNSFDGLFKLTELNFTGSNFYTLGLGALNNLFGLKYLDAQNLFKFTKKIEKNTFRDLKSLEILNLSSLSLETLDSNCFEGLESVKMLLIDNNNLKKLTNHTFQGLKSIVNLDLSHNNIELISDQTFAGLNHLINSLHLERNNITGLSENTFASLNGLQELVLNHNNIRDLPIGLFYNLTNLQLLNLSNNKITVIKNGQFANLTNLIRLDLSHNLIGNIWNEGVFFSLSSLKEMYFDNNYVRIHLSVKELGRNLPNLKYLGISYMNWQCDELMSVIDELNAVSIRYKPIIPVYDDYNVNGISCQR